MNQFKWVSSAATLVGALAFSALPVLSQTGSQSSGGSTSGMSTQDQSQGGQPGMKQGSDSGMSRSGGTAARSDDVKKVQQALKDKGQDPGPIDGVMGAKTKEALRAFQQQQGLKATGTLDNDTKQALGLDQSSSSSGSGSSKSTSSRSSGAKGGSSFNEPAGADVTPSETGPSSNSSKQQ